MRFFIIFIGIVIFLLSFPLFVHAQVTNGCRPIFGGGEVCKQEGNLLIDKKLRNPQTNQFIDHAEIMDPQFAANQPVVFQIVVKNTSNRAISGITLTDIFPRYVSYVKSTGTYEPTTSTVTIPIGKLEGNQSATYTLEGKIMAADILPSVTGPLCVVNQATVTQGRNISSDNSQFCLQNANASQQPGVATNQAPTIQNGTPRPPVLSNPNVATAPKTGPEMLALIGLIPAGITGIYLRRKTS